MTDPTPTPAPAPAPPPTVLETLAKLLGKAAVYIPVAGQFIQIGEMALEDIAAIVSKSGNEPAVLAALHAEYARRIAIADDPNA